MANELIQPVRDNRDALVEKGFLSPEMAQSLAPSQSSEILPTILPENVPAQQPLPEFVPNAAGDIGPIATIKARGNADEPLTAQDLKAKTDLEGAQKIAQAEAVNTAAPTEADSPEVKLAQNVVNADVEAQHAKQIAEDAAKIKLQEEQHKNVLTNQIAAENAVESKAAEEASKQKAKADQIQSEIDKEQDDLKKFNINDIVKNRSTGDSVLASIAVILGGLGAGLTGSNVNQGLQAVNTKLDREFEAQKLGLSEKLAKKRRVYDLLNLQLKQQDQKTSDQLTKQKIALMSAQIDQAKGAVIADQLQNKIQENLSKRLASSEGLNREEVFALKPEMQKRVVPFSDGKFRVTTDPSSAKKLREETLPLAKDAVRGLDRLIEISNTPAGGSLNPVTRAEADVIAQSLKGALRLQLFGPGVMSDAEQALATKIIGNPTSIGSLSVLERKKLETLKDKVVQGTRDQVRSSGIDLPKTTNELRVDQLQKNNKGLTRAAAIKALINTGKWDKETSDF